LRDLLANDAARAVLVRQLGLAFLQVPDLDRMLGMSLVQAAGSAPQMITPEKLDAIDAELDTATSATGTH